MPVFRIPPRWMTHRLSCLLLAACATGFPCGSATAQPVPSVRPERDFIIDFHQFIGQRVQTNGPVELARGVVWSAWRDGWVGDMPFGLRTNGIWDGGRQGFAALNAADSAMTFVFADPVRRIGAFVNYAPYLGQGPFPTIEALDRYGAVIDVLSTDIRTPNGVNEGRFLGFEHEMDDIYAFRYRARFGVLDDLTWTRSGGGFIPMPSSLTMLGLAGLLVTRRRPRFVRL